MIIPDLLPHTTINILCSTKEWKGHRHKCLVKTRSCKRNNMDLAWTCSTAEMDLGRVLKGCLCPTTPQLKPQCLTELCLRYLVLMKTCWPPDTGLLLCTWPRHSMTSTRGKLASWKWLAMEESKQRCRRTCGMRFFQYLLCSDMTFDLARFFLCSTNTSSNSSSTSSSTVDFPTTALLSLLKNDAFDFSSPLSRVSFFSGENTFLNNPFWRFSTYAMCTDDISFQRFNFFKL